MKIMVGGTFSPLHDGHKKLLSRSFELAGDDGHVIIGLSTDQFAGDKNHPIAPYEKRKEILTTFIQDSGYSATWNVIPLEDRYGATLDTDFDALVVSEETFPVSLEINRLRKERGRKKVDIHQITCVLADDGRWISSTRIYRGEIDDHGRVIR
ncbi:phosphopantetheine adenylyltransferase [Methanogenium organophilum]|uniref:Phosphopantetheine adenylyltransferase n=1 Tax=Methanogenium organophilum TaxID=2199 RepID=A0A9X9T8P4_METOG|nr:phosphopantetheine adenylyltransferase [Methanogenium organophilum]WAI01646.1 phosphopantetheine adenylyltransferase [Methanogenium organophilum]